MSNKSSDTKIVLIPEVHQQQNQTNEKPGEDSKNEGELSAESQDEESERIKVTIDVVEDESSGAETIVDDDHVPVIPTIPSSTHTLVIVPIHKSKSSSAMIETSHSDVVVVDIENTTDVLISTVPSSHAGIVNNNRTGDGAGNANNNNNNCMALIPYPPSTIPTKTNQMIPIALLRKSSNCISADECCAGSSGAGLMQLITGCNKVAPAEQANPEEIMSPPTTTVGAVLMLIPKKSDPVCVESSLADPENNRLLENQQLEQQAQQLDPNSAGSNHQQEGVAARPAQSYDSYEEVCRICHDNPSKMELISPCLCKGSMSKVHRACLERWLAESAKSSCEICNYEYNTVRKPKYKGCSSIYQWIRHPLSPSDMRNLFFDIACFFILTPLAAISSWLCVVGAQHYTFGEERRRRAKMHGEASSLWDVHAGHDPRGDASNATWTSVGLLSLTGTLLVAYSVWLFVAIKYHIQAWREWQQRNYTVTIVPFEDGCMGRPPPPRPPRNQSSNNNNNNNGSLLGGNDFHHNGYSFDANPNLLRYSGHNSVMRGRGRNSLFRPSRQTRRDYNLPPIFNRNHFLRNPPPGYTISETTLLYQALYGSDSDAFLNENLLTFFADSSDDITPSSSHLIGEYQQMANIPATATQTPQDQRQQQKSSIQKSAETNASKEENTGCTTTITTTPVEAMEFPGCSSSVNNNEVGSIGKPSSLEIIERNNIQQQQVSESCSKTKQVQENAPNNSNNVVISHIIVSMPCDDDENNENQNQRERRN